jgi:ketosteroid isomerase-like protein
MSSDDKVKTIQSVYEAFGRGDIPTVLDALTDDVDWASEAASTEIPWWGVRHGKDEVAAFFTQLGTATEVLEFTPLVMIGEGDDVLTVVHYRARARGTGKIADMELHHHWRFRDGKIARYRGAEDTLQTLQTFQT